MYMATLRLCSNSMKPSLFSPGILKCFHSQHPPCRPIHYRMTMLYYVSFFNTYVSPCTKLSGPWNWRLSYSAPDVPYLQGQAQRRYLKWLSVAYLPTALWTVTFSVHSGNAFRSPHIPDANGFVSRRSNKEIRVTWMPTELVHTIPMSPIIVFFDLKEQNPDTISPICTCLPM